MKNKWMVLSAIWFVLASATAAAQSMQDLKDLRLKLLLADSVQLISHVATKGFGGRIIPDIDENDTNALRKYREKHPEPPAYQVDGKINSVIITEAVILSARQRNQLIKILGIRETVDSEPGARCSLPHHSIVIYKFGRQSYIDICFGCGHVYSSKDIVFTEQNMNRKKWSDLKMFFQSSGIIQLFEFPGN